MDNNSKQVNPRSIQPSLEELYVLFSAYERRYESGLFSLPPIRETESPMPKERSLDLDRFEQEPHLASWL
jgi:hypothetical protein